MFQHLNLPAQRWLRHVETFRRPPEVELLSDGNKTLQLF
jgi:hypothetical protein